MIETVTLLPGVNLRFFRDDRFKQGCISVQFMRPMCREEAALNALVPAVLLRGCEGTPDLRTITLKLDDLYGASVGALVRRVGDYHATGLYAGFISDRYALGEDRVMAPMVDFIKQLLLAPVTENGVFRKDFVESEKKNLISAIESQKNNKRAYATAQMLSHMCREDSYGIPRLGEIADVKTITPESAYEHYKTLLRESPVELFYVGPAPEEAAELLKAVFEGIDRAPVTLPPQTAFQSCGGGDFEETLDVAQGKLCMGFSTPVTTRQGDFVAMQVCNALFGSGMTGKLFMNVREKMSLCYDIGSSYQGTKGIMTVSSGIDFSRKQAVQEEILRQLQAVRDGDFTEKELQCARESLSSSLRGLHDSPGAIENYYFVAGLNGLGLSPEEYLRRVTEVTPEEVSAAAKTLTLDTVYFLKGVQCDG